MQETQEIQVQSQHQEDPLEEAMATHSSILVWRISHGENPMDSGAWQDYSPKGCKESDMTEQTKHAPSCNYNSTYSFVRNRECCGNSTAKQWTQIGKWERLLGWNLKEKQELTKGKREEVRNNVPWRGNIMTKDQEAKESQACWRGYKPVTPGPSIRTMSSQIHQQKITDCSEQNGQERGYTGRPGSQLTRQSSDSDPS